MTAVFTHELRNYFHSLTAYVFGAFLLILTGIGAMVYNINASITNFEYVLEFVSVIFIIIVPILTMRVIAEERKQKTDQLLYSLPISTTEVVVGKFLALVVVFLIPLVVISAYPLVFARFGEVALSTSYGSLFAFLLMGAGFIAIGIFISSLTENQGFAAGITVAVIGFNYYSVKLSEYVSGTAYSSLVALMVVAFLLAMVAEKLTKNEVLSYGMGFGLFAALVITYFVDKERLEGILPAVMKALSMFSHLDTFVSGVFDLSGVVFFLSVIVFFLFLTVQSLEKRRYN